MTQKLPVRPMTPQSLEGTGHVLAAHADPRPLNGGASVKWDRLMPPEAFDAPMNLGLIRTSPWGPRLTYLERHRHTHQFFMPVRRGRYCVVVGGNREDGPQRDDLQAFLCAAGEGVSFSPGTWHSPLMPLDEALMFLTAMRDSDIPDIELRQIDHELQLPTGAE